jgi:hypothetical protein
MTLDCARVFVRWSIPSPRSASRPNCLMRPSIGRPSPCACRRIACHGSAPPLPPPMRTLCAALQRLFGVGCSGPPSMEAASLATTVRARKEAPASRRLTDALPSSPLAPNLGYVHSSHSQKAANSTRSTRSCRCCAYRASTFSSQMPIVRRGLRSCTGPSEGGCAPSRGVHAVLRMGAYCELPP